MRLGIVLRAEHHRTVGMWVVIGEDIERCRRVADVGTCGGLRRCEGDVGGCSVGVRAARYILVRAYVGGGVDVCTGEHTSDTLPMSGLEATNGRAALTHSMQRPGRAPSQPQRELSAANQAARRCMPLAPSRRHRLCRLAMDSGRNEDRAQDVARRACRLE